MEVSRDEPRQVTLCKDWIRAVLENIDTYQIVSYHIIHYHTRICILHLSFLFQQATHRPPALPPPPPVKWAVTPPFLASSQAASSSSFGTTNLLGFSSSLTPVPVPLGLACPVRCAVTPSVLALSHALSSASCEPLCPGDLLNGSSSRRSSGVLAHSACG